jgi:carboxymethylenebutenolidase
VKDSSLRSEDDVTELSISTPHHRLKGYLATPQGAGPWPGVIVLHDIFGLTDVTRGHADWLAKEGYLAVAPDLFSWAVASVASVP